MRQRYFMYFVSIPLKNSCSRTVPGTFKSVLLNSPRVIHNIVNVGEKGYIKSCPISHLVDYRCNICSEEVNRRNIRELRLYISRNLLKYPNSIWEQIRHFGSEQVVVHNYPLIVVPAYNKFF